MGQAKARIWPRLAYYVANCSAADTKPETPKQAQAASPGTEAAKVVRDAAVPTLVRHPYPQTLNPEPYIPNLEPSEP